jgi:aspartyl-tRNA synthetase
MEKKEEQPTEPEVKGEPKKKKDKKDKKEKKEKRAQEEVYVKDPNDSCASKFGDMELIVSACNPEESAKIVYTSVHELTEELDGKTVRVRARLHNSRIKGKIGFLVLRENFYTVQALMDVGPEISPGMMKYAKSIPKESLIEVVGIVKDPKKDIKGCSQKVELGIQEIRTVSRCVPVLPFQMDDAMRRAVDQDVEEGEEQTQEKKAQKKKQKKKEAKKESEGEAAEEEKQEIHVLQDTRLNNRVLDLRVPANQALMKLQSGVGKYFRDFLYNKDFVEIHSPKIIPGVSEGGTQVFKLQYFGREACLAQSPQLYKQMGVCGDLTRVFEIAPAFRAENSNTKRHLCEFTMLDMEMAFKNHYFEVVDLLGEMFNYIFENLAKNFKKELAVVNDQYPSEPFVWRKPALKLDFLEGVKLLEEAGIKQSPSEDLSSESEKALGEIVRKKYDTDFYILYRYPKNARPFYTMRDPKDPNYTNSYDFFMRGEEVTSGAQRIHDTKMLAESATAAGIPLDTLKDYLDAFKYGPPPHAGCGIGLERIVKLFCGIKNIRKCIMFTRDPKRLNP